MFDSSHYKFPPDIIFHNLPPEEEIEDKRVLLPGEDWDLDRDDCLYTWFERVIGLIKKVCRYRFISSEKQRTQHNCTITSPSLSLN